MVTRKRDLSIKGIPASPGFAMGEARVIYKWEQTIQERILSESEAEQEIARLDTAIEGTLIELEEWRKSAGQKIGGPVAKIFDTQMMIAADREFLKKVKEEIKTGLRNAEYVYSMLVDSAMEPLRASSDAYMRQMVSDIEAVSRRVISHLVGHGDGQDSKYPPDCVFVAQEFTPGEVLTLYERNAAAIVTSVGSAVSHMSLIARSLLVPAVVGVAQAHLKIKSGDRLVVDGDSGTVTINPADKEWNELRHKKVKLSTRHISRLQKLPVFPPQTADGVEIELAANIDLPGPIDEILAERKIGVGLYRTEFLYLQTGSFPSEDRQFEVYKTVAEKYYPRPVVIRTFDLGSDKYFVGDESIRESNPALGWRGIRAALDMPKVFKDQLKAILRASIKKNVRILLPMVADSSELARANKLIKSSMTELAQRGDDFNHDIEVGVMVEVPSAAVAAEYMAKKVSFFSIGSNDLTQYTLAVDRDNDRLAKIFNPLHPAVLRLIEISISAAKNNGIPISMCGEMSGDIISIPLLIGLGINQLSMNPSKLPDACQLIARIKYKDTIELANEIIHLSTLKEIEGRLLEYNMSLK